MPADLKIIFKANDNPTEDYYTELREDGENIKAIEHHDGKEMETEISWIFVGEGDQNGLPVLDTPQIIYTDMSKNETKKYIETWIEHTEYRDTEHYNKARRYDNYLEDFIIHKYKGDFREIYFDGELLTQKRSYSMFKKAQLEEFLKYLESDLEHILKTADLTGNLNDETVIRNNISDIKRHLEDGLHESKRIVIDFDTFTKNL